MIDTTRADREGTAQALGRMEGNPDPPILSSGPLGWNGLVAERYRHSPAEHHFPAIREYTASLYLGQPVRSVRWSGDGIHEGATSRGDVTVKASGQPVGWHFDKEVDLDRKSTRLNSSHANISYAVFCLKKKNEDHTA